MRKIKRLILVRHGHRDTAIRDRDNGLSEKGWEQEKDFRRAFEDELRGKHVHVCSSPKKRCVETVAGLAEKFHLTVKVDPLLDEQNGSESEKELHARIDHFLSTWMQAPEEYWIAASHGDWIPTAYEKLTGIVEVVKKGQWVEIKLTVSI